MTSIPKTKAKEIRVNIAQENTKGGRFRKTSVPLGPCQSLSEFFCYQVFERERPMITIEAVLESIPGQAMVWRGIEP